MVQQDLKLVIALSRTYRSLLNAIEKSLREAELSVSEFGVLEFLHHKGPHPVQEIAGRILVSSGTITYVIDKLVRKSLVFRRQCTEDSRRFYIELTERGEELIAKLFPLHEAHVKKLFADLDEPAKKIMTRNLFLLNDSINTNEMKENDDEPFIL